MENQLKKISTKELVEELSQREGVNVTIAKPYEEKEITFKGPAIILEAID